MSLFTRYRLRLTFVVNDSFKESSSGLVYVREMIWLSLFVLNRRSSDVKRLRTSRIITFGQLVKS